MGMFYLVPSVTNRRLCRRRAGPAGAVSFPGDSAAQETDPSLCGLGPCHVTDRANVA